MNSQITTTAARPGCKYPGCGHPAAPAGGTGRPPEYCAGRGHTRVSAWRERRRLAAEQAGTTISPADDVSPVTMAKMTGAELLRSLHTEADRIAALGVGLRDRIDTLTDPTAAEAEVEAVHAAAEQRAAAAAARAALPQLLSHITEKEQQRAPGSEPRNWQANAQVLMTIQDFLITDAARHAIPRTRTAQPVLNGGPL